VSQVGPEAEISMYTGDPPKFQRPYSGYVIGEGKFVITFGNVRQQSGDDGPTIFKARLVGADQVFDCSVNWAPRDDSDLNITLLELMNLSRNWPPRCRPSISEDLSAMAKSHAI
jgi:hypothetical protein